jgi:hypothetical protein
MKDDERLNNSHHKTRLGDETQGCKQNKNSQGCQGKKSFSKDYTSQMSFLY